MQVATRCTSNATRCQTSSGQPCHNSPWTARWSLCNASYNVVTRCIRYATRCGITELCTCSLRRSVSRPAFTQTSAPVSPFSRLGLPRLVFVREWARKKNEFVTDRQEKTNSDPTIKKKTDPYPDEIPLENCIRICPTNANALYPTLR